LLFTPDSLISSHAGGTVLYVWLYPYCSPPPRLCTDTAGYIHILIFRKVSNRDSGFSKVWNQNRNGGLLRLQIFSGAYWSPMPENIFYKKGKIGVNVIHVSKRHEKKFNIQVQF
jgi:hypothetical protein